MKQCTLYTVLYGTAKTFAWSAGLVLCRGLSLPGIKEKILATAPGFFHDFLAKTPPPKIKMKDGKKTSIYTYIVCSEPPVSTQNVPKLNIGHPYWRED
jgi:hypothetical protein